MQIPSLDPSKETVAQLNELIKHHRASLEVCEAAASRLSDIEERQEIRHMVSDHLRHVDELSKLVEKLGGKATIDKADLERDRSDIRELEKDERLLTALFVDEQRVAQVYDDVVGEVPADDVGKALDRGQQTVERHRNWLQSRLQA